MPFGFAARRAAASPRLTEPLLSSAMAMGLQQQPAVSGTSATTEDAHVSHVAESQLALEANEPSIPEATAAESLPESTSLPQRPRRWLFSYSRSNNAADGENSISEQLCHSLAWAPTTHWVAKVILPVLIVYTHYLFWKGQTIPMWRLTSHWTGATIDYTTTSRDTRYALEILHIPTTGTIALPPQDKTMRTFTYLYAIQELWRAHHMPGVFLPRLAAAGLFMFSGVWPHVKLFMLLLTWWFSKHAIRRRRCLTSLSVLGKWSLVDVLVVCVMVGVLNLQWTFTAPSVLEGIQNNLPDVVALVHSLYSAEQLCSMALHYSCTNPSIFSHQLECKACRSTVNSWFDHPESASKILRGLSVSGGGTGTLSVAGLDGIYSFCGAVILSILLSVVVDWYDHQSRRRRRRQQIAHQPQHQPVWQTGALTLAGIHEEDSSADATPEISGTLSDGGSANAEETTDQGSFAARNEPSTSLHELLLLEEGASHVASEPNRDIRSSADADFDRRVLVERQQCPNKIWQGTAWITTGIVIAATSSVTLERRVHGALPTLLHRIMGVEWTKHYSFWQLGWTTAMAGGWDRMLMATFVWFVIVGPLVRCLLCIVASRTTATAEMSMRAVAVAHRRHRRLSTYIDFVGAFCAWEVFAVAVCMVDLLMPSITATILLDKRCVQIAAQTGDTTCLEVEFVTRSTFALVLVGGSLLVLVSQRIRSTKTYYA
jgi:Paraquat-inducible protein A